MGKLPTCYGLATLKLRRN